MGVPIPVNGVAAQKISTKVSKPYLISASLTNTGPVYLGLDSSVSPNNYGFPLSPGQSLTWTEINSDVWGLMDVNNTGTVTIAYEASAAASAVVTSKLAVLPTLLKSYPVSYTATGSFQNPDLNAGEFLDVSGYSSVVVVITNVATNNANFSGTNFVSVGGIFSEKGYGNGQVSAVGGSSLCEFLLASKQDLTAEQSYQFPVKGKKFNPFANVQTNAYAGGSGTLIMAVYGSSQSVSVPIYRNFSNSSNASGVEGLITATLTGANTIDLFVNSKSGPCTFDLVGGGAAGQYIFMNAWRQGVKSILTQKINGTSPYTPASLVLPQYPISMTLGVPASSNASYAITQ